MSFLKTALRRWRHGRPIVVVSGLPRSGTSMAMKMLEAGGLDIVTDNARTADEDNPKGYYEDERVLHLHKEGDKEWLSSARGKAIKIISFLLEHLPADNNYKVIFMRRHLDEVLASQSKMLERRGTEDDIADADMRETYTNHLLKVKAVLRCRDHLEWLEVDYKGALENPRREAERIREFLGFEIDVDKMTGVVDERLYRNRAQS